MANNTNDITKTGPKSYRDLQKENNAAYQSALNESSIAKKMNFNRSYAPSTSFIYEGKEQSPILQQHTGDYWGNSMFDNPSANEEEFQLNSLNDTRAENQPWYAKLGAGIGKGIVLAGTTFLDGTVGLLAGIGTAVSEGRWSGLFDNAVSNGLNEINRLIEDILPNYRTQEEQERPWYENLGTVNFWADSFLKNLGFTVGAFYSGGLFTKALKGVKWLSSGLGAALTGSIFSAVNEGRVEANNTMHDLLELHTQQLRDAYNRRYSEIVNSSMPDIDKQKALDELDAYFDREDAKNIDNARLAGDIDLIGNTILLSLDNFNTYGRLFARGFKNAEKTAQNSLRTAARHADEKLSSRIIRNADGSYGFNKYGAKDIAKSGLKIAALEGNEEMAQQFLSNFSGNVRSYDSPDAYYNALLDSNAEQKTMDTTKALAQAFTDSYGDGSQWEQFAVGALTGILGMSTFGRVNNSDSNTYLGRGKVIGLSGGIFGEMGQNREANQRGQEIANRMNSFVQKLKDHQRYFTQSQSFTDAMDGFAKDGDAFEFKNAEDNEAFSAMSAFAQAGRLDDYKQMVNADFDNMSDEDLDAIAKMTSQDTDDDSSAKDQGWRNADGTYMSETEEGRQQMRYELKKKRDKILSQIDAYTDSLDRVRGIGNNSLTDDQVNELAWLDWKVGQFNDRLEQVTSEANAPFKSIKEGVDYMIQALEKEHDSIIADGDEDKKDKNGNNILKENEKQQAKYKNISNVLTQLINSDLRGLASIKPEDFNDAIKEMNSTKFFKNFNAYSNVTATDYGDALKSVVDTFKLLGARNEFNKRLKEFTEDPLKLIQNRQKIDKEKAKTEKVKHAVKTKDKIDNASVSDIVSQMESGDITDDDFDSLLNDIDASLDEEDDSISSTKGKINAAKDIIESSHRAEDKLDNLADSSDVEGLAEEVQQAVQDAKSLLAASKSKANSKDELFDTESEAWNDPNNLPITDEVQQALSEMSSEEAESFLQGRIDRAKNAMEKVKSFIYDEDKESSKMPNTEEQAKNKKAAEESEKKRREDDKEASGTVASSDSDSPGASVTKVNLGGEQPKEPDTTANLSARELLKDVELPEETAEDTYNNVDNILKGVDYAWKRGLRGKDLHDAITSTKSWNEVIQAVPDLGDRINSYISNKYNIKPKAEAKTEAKTDNAEEPSEVRTQESDPNENANIVKGLWDAKPEKVEYGYWKPTTTEIGIHDDASDSHPFYETAQVINSVFDKNFKDLDPYEQFVYEHYIKPGYIRHKYDAKQLQSMKAVYEYLEKHSAFDNVNKGFVKKDTTIYFTIDNTLNKDAGEIIVLMTLKDGTVVGDLSGKDATSIINEYKDKFKEEEKRPDTWTSKTTTTVRQMMRGKVPYSVDTNNVNKVFEGNDDSFKLGISMGIGNAAPIFASAGRTKMQGSSKLEQTIVPPLNAVLGQPYILLPTAGKTQRMCVPFNMKRFTKETADSQLGKAIKSVISTIPDGTDKDNAMSVKTGLEELLAAEFHVNYDKDNNGNDIVRITRKMSYDNHQETIYNGPIANENLVQNIVDALCKDGGTPFEVSRKYVNSKYNLNGTPISYNKMIGEVSDVNLPLGTTSTINDWFILNPPNGKASRVTSTGNNTKQTTAGSIRTVSVNGVGDVQVNTSSWRIVSSAKPLTEEQEDIARAMAYGGIYETKAIANGVPYKTRWGVFDPNTQKFLTSEDNGGVVVKHFSLSPEEEKSDDDSDAQQSASREALPTIQTEKKSKSGKDTKGQYVDTLDNDGVHHIKFEGSNIAKRSIHKEDLDKLGLSVDDILGKKEEWNNEGYYDEALEAFNENGVKVNEATVDNNGNVTSVGIVENGAIPTLITGNSAKKVFDAVFPELAKEQSEGVQLLNTKWVKIDGSGHFILNSSVTIDDLKKLSDFDKYFTIVSSEAPLQESTGFDLINSGDLSKSDDKGNRRVMRKAQIALRGKNNEDASAGKRTLRDSFKEVGLENGEFAGTISTNDSRATAITDDGEVKIYDGVGLNHGQAEAIRKGARRVFEDPNATEQQLHDAIVSAGRKTKASANVLSYLYKALNAVKQGRMTVDEAMALLEYHMYVDDDVHKKLLSTLDSPEQGNEEQKNDEDSELDNMPDDYVPTPPENTGQKASFTDEQEKQFANLLDPYYEGGGASIENDLFNGKELPKDVDDELGNHSFTGATPSIATVNWVLANIDPSIKEKYLSSFASFNQGNEPEVVATKVQPEGVQLLNTKWVKIDGSGHFILDPSVTIDDLKKLSDFDKYFTIVSSEAPLQESTGFDLINSGDLSEPDDKGNRRVKRKAQIALRGKNNEDASAAKKIGDKIVSDSKNVQLTDDKKYYLIGGTKYARVTSIIQADAEGEKFDENSKWITPSTNIGTGLDELGRDFMSGRITFDPGDKEHPYRVEGVPVEDVYPNINRDSAKSYLNQWTKLKSALDKRGIHIIPREVVAKGQLNIKDKDGKDHTINVAGTLDLLGYDDEGNWYIFDMKTHRSDITDSKKSKWSRQLSLYKKFLEDEYGIKVSVLAIIPTKVNYPAPTDTNIYGVDTNKPSLYNGVESNQLTLHGKPYKESNPVMGKMIVLTETTPNIQLEKLSDSEKAILSDYDSTKVNYQPKGHEVSGDLDANAKKKGLTATKKNESVWSVLSNEQKTAILKNGNMKAKQIMQKLAGAYYSKAKPEGALFDEKRLGGSVDEFLGVARNRLATTEKYTPWKPEKELGWLRKALPQFSDDEHKRMIHGFIELDGRRKAYGRFKQGVIELSDIAARGTVYHEAFHAVFNTLLDSDEQTDVMNAARAKYGDLGSIQLEENLAEDFRRYIQWEQTPVIGTLVKAFRTIKHIVFGLLNKNSVLDKLYYNIDRGRFANKVAGTTNADRPRLYAPDINDAIHKLDSDYRRGKQLEGTISSNMKSVIDKFIKDNDLKDVAYAVKYNNSDKWVMRVTKKNYNEKRNFLMNRLISIYNSELSSDERNSEKALLEQEEREDEQFNRAIEQWHRDKLMYGNLAEDDKLYLQERGISIDEYNEMSPFEKEILFRCKY